MTVLICQLVIYLIFSTYQTSTVSLFLYTFYFLFLNIPIVDFALTMSFSFFFPKEIETISLTHSNKKR